MNLVFFFNMKMLTI